jgi:protein-tyrosine phosphatase
MIKKLSNKRQKTDEEVSSYTKVLNRLYLGNIDAARDIKFINDKNISAILNCSKAHDIPNHYTHKGIEYLRIPVDDSLKERDFEKMSNLLPLAVEYIHKHINVEKNNLLVHCWAGRQRSAICIAAYMVKYLDMTPKNAVVYIQDKRHEAFHFGKSVNFDQALNKYYKSLQCKTKKSDLVGERI